MRPTVFLYVFVAIISFQFVASAHAGTSPWSGLNLERLEKTCSYFDNRAKFKPRGPNADLVVTLADGCSVALDQLTGVTGADPYAAKRARLYLEMLASYKEKLVQIRLQDFARARAITKTRKPGFSHAAGEIGLSKSGEYLIAKHMGVLRRFNDWQRVTAFRFASK